MTYVIEGLSPEPFSTWFGQPDAALQRAGIIRVTAAHTPGFPCRVTLEDAQPGETLLLLHHVSHAVDTPYRSAYAIYVREGARRAARHVDAVPPVFEGRPLGLRGFSADGMLAAARLAGPGGADAAIRALLDDPAVAYIDVHNAAHGCFAARVERSGT